MRFGTSYFELSYYTECFIDFVIDSLRACLVEYYNIPNYLVRNL